MPNFEAWNKNFHKESNKILSKNNVKNSIKSL